MNVGLVVHACLAVGGELVLADAAADILGVRARRAEAELGAGRVGVSVVVDDSAVGSAAEEGAVTIVTAVVARVRGRESSRVSSRDNQPVLRVEVEVELRVVTLAMPLALDSNVKSLPGRTGFGRCGRWAR